MARPTGHKIRDPLLARYLHDWRWSELRRRAWAQVNDWLKNDHCFGYDGKTILRLLDAAMEALEQIEGNSHGQAKDQT